MPEGPILDVIPYVAADGYTVKMTVLPTLIQFVGYDDRGPFAVIAQGGAGSTVANPLVAQLPLPRLRSRQVLYQRCGMGWPSRRSWWNDFRGCGQA